MNVIVNCKNHVRGRLLSSLVTEAKKGNLIHIYNTQQLILTGNPRYLESKYRRIIAAGHTKRGPFVTKKAESLLRRTIYGMFKKLSNKVFIHDNKPDIEGIQWPEATPRIYKKAYYYKELIRRINSR